jgi:hypothetical protein
MTQETAMPPDPIEPTTSTVTINRTAANKHLRLGELRAFLGEADRCGIDDQAVVNGRINWTGSIRSLEVTG